MTPLLFPVVPGREQDVGDVIGGDGASTRISVVGGNRLGSGRELIPLEDLAAGELGGQGAGGGMSDGVRSTSFSVGMPSGPAAFRTSAR